MQHSALSYVDAVVWYVDVLFGNEAPTSAVARGVYVVLFGVLCCVA
jgi:hypothetical protein